MKRLLSLIALFVLFLLASLAPCVRIDVASSQESLFE